MKHSSSPSSKPQPSEAPSQIIPFTFESKEIRIIPDESGNPWWVAKDVCDVLNIANPTQAVQQLDDDERAMKNIGRQGDVNIINESGLYTLIIRSNKPEAKKFRKWITSEVLPAIRKTGSYAAGQKKTTKICPICKRVLTTDHFHRDARTNDGYRIVCKECRACQMQDRLQLKLDVLRTDINRKRMETDASEWSASWNTLCECHSDIQQAVERLRKDVTEMLPGKSLRSIPKDADVLEYVRLHYSALEKAVRQINILSEVLMWRSPKVLAFNLELGNPRY